MNEDDFKTPKDLAEYLIGTCSGIDPIEIFGHDREKLLEFDSIVFRCESCEWWCGTDELNESEEGKWLCQQYFDDD